MKVIRGWLDSLDWSLAPDDTDYWPVWSRDDMSDPVVIVPASYVDVVEALVGALEPFAKFACDPVGSCDGDRCYNCTAHIALQQYREAVQ